jgi:hypothetical protein
MKIRRTASPNRERFNADGVRKKNANTPSPMSCELALSGAQKFDFVEPFVLRTLVRAA